MHRVKRCLFTRNFNKTDFKKRKKTIFFNSCAISNIVHFVMVKKDYKRRAMTNSLCIWHDFQKTRIERQFWSTFLNVLFIELTKGSSNIFFYFQLLSFLDEIIDLIEKERNKFGEEEIIRLRVCLTGFKEGKWDCFLGLLRYILTANVGMNERGH